MKKIITLLLAVVFVVGMALPTHALADRETDGSQTHPSPHDPTNENPLHVMTIYDITNEVYGDEVYGDYMGDAAWYPEKTYPGSYIEIPLLHGGFYDEEGGAIFGWDPENPTYGPTVFQLKTNHITPQIQIGKGAEYIESVEIVRFTPTHRNPAQAAIRVTFVPEYIATAEFEYKFTIYLSRAGYRTDSAEIFSGLFSNDIYDVYKIDYLFIGDGQVAYAESGTQMGLTLGLGNGVMFHRDMFIGERYYGFATLHGNDFQDPITAAYRKSINTVIDITSVDLKVNSGYITFEKELSQPKFFVYDLAGKFVGMSNEKLPYSTRYYLAVEEIEIDARLSQHPVPEKHEAAMNSAVERFIKGGRASVGIATETAE